MKPRAADASYGTNCLLCAFLVAYDANMVNYKWNKGKGTVKILNDVMAEFDVVSVDCTEKNVTYVSGIYDFSMFSQRKRFL